MINVFYMRINLKSLLPNKEAFSASLNNHINNYQSPSDRNRSMLAYSLLKYVLKEDILDVSFSSSGKPVYEKCFISISHSGDYVAVGYGNSSFGIDIQIKKEINDKLKNRVMGNHKNDFFTYWTLLEATSKMKDIPLTKLFKKDVEGITKKITNKMSEYTLSVVLEKKEQVNIKEIYMEEIEESLR